MFAASCSADVLKISINDAIQPVTAEFIGRALDLAAANHDQAVLIEINTPGGLVDSTRDIIEKIVASPVPVIIYVTPSGSRAASVGFFILESADVAAMAPGTNTGAAHPVILGGEKMDDIMKQKMENDAAALMRSVVAKRGRNVELAESAVRESKSFTEQEALDKKLIEYIAPNEQDLFRQLNGKSFKRFNGATVTLKLDERTGARLPDDAQAAHPHLPHGPERRVHPAGHRRARALCGIQPSRRGHSRNRWRGLYSFGSIRVEPDASTLRRDCHDHRRLCALRCSKPSSPATACSPPAALSY